MSSHTCWQVKTLLIVTLYGYDIHLRVCFTKPLALALGKDLKSHKECLAFMKHYYGHFYLHEEAAVKRNLL